MPEIKDIISLINESISFLPEEKEVLINYYLDNPNDTEKIYNILHGEKLFFNTMQQEYIEKFKNLQKKYLDVAEVSEKKKYKCQMDEMMQKIKSIKKKEEQEKIEDINFDNIA